MDEKERKIQVDLATLFAEVRNTPVRPDPYLTTRVMARWRERQASRVASRGWKWLGLGASSLSAAMATLLVLWHFRAPHFEAFVGQPFVVKLEVRDLGQVAIAKARIRLPDGVFFEIEEYPELRHSRDLTLAWRNRDQKEFIPFVLSASEEGTKTIAVDFFDAENNLVGTRRVDVLLKKSLPKG